MKRSVLSLLIYMLCSVAVAGGSESPVPDRTVPLSQRVVTALDHLTVLEYDEPVSQAAAGSPAFQIERQDNKVFIKPLKSGVTTNLFIWTASNKSFSYELTVGDVINMNAEIRIAVPKPNATAATGDTSAQMEQVADMLITRTLLGAEPVDGVGLKTPKNRVGLRIQQVFRSRNSLYIQYSIENLSGRSYRITTPNLYEIQVEQSRVSLLNLKGRQLDQQIIDEFGRTVQIPLPIAHADSQAGDIAPRERKQGIIALRRSQDPSSPLMLRIAFDTNVSATVVF
jgi:Conjugal transfer protein